MSGRRLLIVLALDVVAVAWGLRVLQMNYQRAHLPQPPNARLDQIDIRYFAYRGMLTEDVNRVYQLPVEIVGADSAWVTVQKGPKGHSEVLMVRDGRGWKKGGSTRGTYYP